MEPMISFLGRALRETREGAGLVLRDVDYYGRKRGGKGHDAGKLSRIERGDMKRWPADIDVIVRAYAHLCETSDTAIWSRALELYGEAEGRRSTRRARRHGQRRNADRLDRGDS